MTTRLHRGLSLAGNRVVMPLKVCREISAIGNAGVARSTVGKAVGEVIGLSRSFQLVDRLTTLARRTIGSELCPKGFSIKRMCYARSASRLAIATSTCSTINCHFSSSMAGSMAGRAWSANASVRSTAHDSTRIIS